ncbi:hypothetical protein Lser_V15G30027 [Lactuca serriola]
MSQFLLRDIFKRKQHTSVLFINKHTNDAKSVGNISAPLSTPVLSTPALSSSSSRTTLSSVSTVSAPTFVSHVGTMGATSSTHVSSIPTSSNQSSLPTSSTQSSVPTSIQSSTPASTTSSVPRFTANCSELVEENVGVQHQEYLHGPTGLDVRLYIGVRDKELFPSGPCSSVIYESFGERADLNRYSWANLSDKTKLLYWDKKSAIGMMQKLHYSRLIGKIRQRKDIDNRDVVDGQALSTHTSGSASHSKIASDLYICRKSFGDMIRHIMNYSYIHTLRITMELTKLKKIHDDFMERCDRLEAIGEEIDEDKLFYDVGGHDRKKRLYGFGSYGKRICSSKGSSETHREQYEDNNAETKVEIEYLKKLVETQREQYEDIQQKYEDV